MILPFSLRARRSIRQAWTASHTERAKDKHDAQVAVIDQTALPPFFAPG